MQENPLRPRFARLSHALQGSGPFAPTVLYGGMGGMSKPTGIAGECAITAYPRESAEKYAARVACAVYENHLLQACEHFAAYLSRKQPQRSAGANPLVAAMLDDCDDAGTAMDVFMRRLVVDTKARGSMLVLLQMPTLPEGASMAQAQRIAPYLQAIAPDTVAAYALDARGLLASVDVASSYLHEGKTIAVTRRWNATHWQVWNGQQLIAQGEHPFGACPVLAVTDSGAPFPSLGKYAQIADLSERLYNMRSELHEILRSQTFSLLTLQIPLEVPNPAQYARDASSTIGTHSLLVHQGQTPAFIAPDSGPAQTYLASMSELQTSIATIGMEAASLPGQTAESGLARRLRFEALNAELASFALVMQDLEQRVWALVQRALGITQTVQVQWPTDYNLTDSASELDILALMQATGFPEAVLAEKRRAIALAEFDRADPSTQARLMAAIDEQAQARSAP